MLREEWEAQGRPTTGKVCPPRRASESGLLALNTLQTRVQERWGELGHEPIGPHEARHTTATWLDHAGVSPKVISEFMGQKTPEYQLGAARITFAALHARPPRRAGAPASSSTSSSWRGPRATTPIEIATLAAR